MQMIKKIFSRREPALLIIIIALSLIISIFSPHFLSGTNIISMFVALTVEGIIVLGMVLLLIIAGLDLSVGAVMAFTGVSVAMMINKGIPVFLAILAALLLALAIGLLNGFLISEIGLNSFITTLGMMMVVKGLMLVISQGKAVLNMPASFKAIGQGKIAGIQYPIIIMITLVIVMDLLVRHTRFMRQTYYIGSSELASQLNGIHVKKIKMLMYCLSSFFAGLAGVLITARFGNASVTLGDNTAMNVITAAIIGGASLNGGQGTVLGAFLGAVFMQLISTSLNMLNVNMYWQNFVTGAILIIAILIDAVNGKRKSGKKVIA
ncbi:ABC transporter permease [Diplocloster hominis]|uniref:ABC transporter permease n=1 Tax=Diplocloster hominis TaxID=3079010 RepID=UPI0031BAB143